MVVVDPPEGFSPLCILFAKVGQGLIQRRAQLLIQRLSKCLSVEERIQQAAVRSCIPSELL